MMVELFIMVRIAKQFVYSLMCLLIKERKLKGSSMIRIKGGPMDCVCDKSVTQPMEKSGAVSGKTSLSLE